ncbi:TetR/AcrR family transcriptional regulator [Paenibacillus planticolens]|uniref:TetR family transcriptional regulator n=1 Tax=Paenibacillus planticolens TaxID=2654976 RepID=A0ABX1ZJP1_9BACL|nr:TetR-like C-terminal domain-containing protein [Paenibacillus planticolens]NOV00310.1 TetR family transcriptional regulator [Paenibacillus planticolens]
MTEKIDRRKAKTKQALRDALVALIREKAIESITVSDLTRKADINRGTFYLHYRDVLDLRDHIKAEVQEGLLRIVAHLEPKDMFNQASEGKVYDGLIRVYEYFDSQADFFEVMLGQNGDLSFSSLMKETIHTHMYRKLIAAQPQNDMLVPADILIGYVASAHFGFILEWIRSGRKQTPAELAKYMSDIMYHGPLRALGFLPPKTQ